MLKLFRSFMLTFCLCLMAATAFAAQVQVEPSVHPQHQDVTIPVVTVPDNQQASDAINAAIKENIQAFISQSDECYKDNEDWNKVYIGNSYTVTCNDGAVLSIVLSKYINVEHAAHPMHYIHGLNFNPRTGEKIVSADLKEFSAEKYGKDI